MFLARWSHGEKRVTKSCFEFSGYCVSSVMSDQAWRVSTYAYCTVGLILVVHRYFRFFFFFHRRKNFMNDFLRLKTIIVAFYRIMLNDSIKQLHFVGCISTEKKSLVKVS